LIIQAETNMKMKDAPIGQVAEYCTKKNENLSSRVAQEIST